jgi:hypothetical protein
MMPPAPAVTIVTPVRNRRHLLGRAIRSVIGQTRGDWEHVIVDDASTDRPEEIVRECGDGRIRFERLPGHRGANAARNLAIARGRGAIVTFLDSDDEFLPTRLERTLPLFESDPATDLVISSFETRKGDRVTRSVNHACRLPPDAFERALLSHAVFLGGTAITVRRDLLDRCGGFAEGLARMQDREMLLSAADAQARAGRQGATLLDRIDWIKHQQDDSISTPAEGFVSALGAMLGRHPGAAERHESLVRYHVARRMLSHLLKGDLRTARSAHRENMEVEQFGFGTRALAVGYVRGRLDRAAVSRELATRGRPERSG